MHYRECQEEEKPERPVLSSIVIFFLHQLLALNYSSYTYTASSDGYSAPQAAAVGGGASSSSAVAAYVKSNPTQDIDMEGGEDFGDVRHVLLRFVVCMND